MPNPTARRWWIIALVGLLVLGLAGAGIGYAFSRGQSAPTAHIVRPGTTTKVGPAGGIVWNGPHTVGVQVAKNGVSQPTNITFAAPAQPTPESPMSALGVVVGQPVDIESSSRITDADVIFAFDQRQVPADATLPGQPTPTIQNAGIEVFNDTIGAWIPIPTTIDAQHSLLRAHAPHFSDYRVVISKIGTQLVDIGKATVNVTLTAASVPLKFLNEVGTAILKNLFNDLLGKFDSSKYQCTPKDTGYTVTTKDQTGQDKLAACVVRNGKSDQLLMKDGLALPFAFKADSRTVRPNLAATATDIFNLGENVAGLTSGTSFVSGLDTGTLNMASPPKQFVVNGQVSWVAVSLDLTVGLLAALVPAGKAVSVATKTAVADISREVVSVDAAGAVVSYTKVRLQVQLVFKQKNTPLAVTNQILGGLDAANCALSAAGSVKAKDWSSAVTAVAGIAQDCLVKALTDTVSEANAAIGQLSSLVEGVKVLPEFGQLLALGVVNTILRKDNGKVAFTVYRGNPALDPFVGNFSFNCSYYTIKITIRSDYRGTWTISNTPDGSDGTITFHLKAGPDPGFITGGILTARAEFDSSTVPGYIPNTDTNFMLVKKNEIDIAGKNAGGVQDQVFRNNTGTNC